MISMLVAADIMTYLATIGNSVVKIYSERNDPTRRNAILRYVLRRVYRKADMFICQSKKVYDYYVFIPKKRKKIIPNMLDLRSLPAPCIDEENHTIVSVGRLTEQKNFEMLIEAFKEAMPKIPDDSNLVIYGAGPLEEKLAAKIKNEGLSKKVFLKGAQSDVLNKMAGCALFVLPSLYEGFPNVLLEAMAVGLPVISTDFFTGVAKELIKKENGIIVAVGDEKEMAKAIVKIMNDDMMRKKCRMNNVEVMGLFGAEKVGEEWKKMIIGVVRGKNV